MRRALRGYLPRMLTLLLERHENVALEKVGEFVQRLLAEGVRMVVVTVQADGTHCTISVQRD